MDDEKAVLYIQATYVIQRDSWIEAIRRGRLSCGRKRDTTTIPADCMVA